MMKYWPFAYYLKESLFLKELIEVLEMSDMDKLEPYLGKILKRYIQAVSSQHLNVRLTAINYFENNHFINLITAYKKKIYPMLVPAIGEISDAHWNK
jgi:serine/threonine-protein phosphatase 2A regulatory subunit B'